MIDDKNPFDPKKVEKDLQNQSQVEKVEKSQEANFSKKEGEEEIAKISFLQKIKKRIKRKEKPVVEQPQTEEVEVESKEEEPPEELPQNETIESEEQEEKGPIKIIGPNQIKKGSSANLEARGEDFDYDWQSSNSTVAYVAGNGKGAIVSGVSKGRAEITAVGKESEQTGKIQIIVLDDDQEEKKKEEESEKEKPEPEETQKPEQELEKAPQGEAADLGEGAKEMGTAESEAAVTGASGAAEGATATAGAETAAATAGAGAAEGAAVAGATAAPILPYILIALSIILGIVAIVILIILISSVLKNAGRTPPEYPDYNTQADSKNAGIVTAASQNKDAGLLAKAIGLETQDVLEGIENEAIANNNFLNAKNVFAQEDLVQDMDKLKTNKNTLLYSLPKKQDYIKEKITENKNLINSLAQSNSDKTKIKDAQSEINEIETDYSKYLNIDSPILQINPFDLNMIKTGQVDKRIILVLKKLVDFSLDQQKTDPGRWTTFKIAQIYKADPYDKRETPLDEDQKFVSAHHFGQALDITVVGNYKCKKKGLTGSETTWYPCYVSYQGGGPQNPSIDKSKNYAALTIPYALSSLQESIGEIDISGSRNFYSIFEYLGQQTIREELNIDENFWDNSTPFSEDKILASLIAQKTNLPIGAVSAFLYSNDTKSIDRGTVEVNLNLAQGSLSGSNWNEILMNVFKAYMRQTLGLQGTSTNDFTSNQDLGKGILEKSFGKNPAKDKVFSAISRSNTYYQNLWQLNEDELKQLQKKQNLESLEQNIGNKFKESFIKPDDPNARNNWLGLPEGDLNNPDYQKKAGRYILAKTLNLDDINQAFEDSDYFFQKAPLSPELAFDLCANNNESTCPAYEIIKDPNNYFKKVGDSIISKKDMGLELNSDLGNDFKKAVGKNQISLTDLAEIKADSAKNEKITSLLRQYINSILLDNLEIRTELPGIFEENRITNGDFSFVLPLLGLNLVSREATLPPNTLEKLFLPNVKVTDVMGELAGFEALQALGVNPWGIDKSIFPDDWYKNPETFGQIAAVNWLSDYGIEIGSLDQNGKLQIDIKNFDDFLNTIVGESEDQGLVIPDNLAAFFGLSGESLKSIIQDFHNNKNQSAAQTILSETADQRLGLTPGTTFSLLSGQIDFDNWLKNSWQNSALLPLANQEATSALGLPEGSVVNIQDLVNGINNNDSTSINAFLFDVAQAKLGATFKIPPTIIYSLFNSGGDYDSQIENLRNIAVDKIVQNIASNQDQYDALKTAYTNYFYGQDNNILKSYIASSLDIPDSDTQYFINNDLQAAVKIIGAAKINQQIRINLGTEGIGYDQIKEMFFGDSNLQKPDPNNQSALKSYQEKQAENKERALKQTGYSLSDSYLISQDPTVPIGTSEILSTGTQAQKNRLLVDYVSNKAGIPGSLINDLVLSEDFDLQNLNVQNFVASIPGIDKYIDKAQQLQNVLSDLKTFSETKDIGSFSLGSAAFLQDKTGIPISDLQQWNYALSNPSGLDTQMFFASKLGITNAIDGALGIPGFSTMVVGAVQCAGGNAFACATTALNVLSSILGIGKVSCENPQATAQKQIRTTLTEIINTDPTPTKIITLRDQDLYYFSGLDDNGEATAGLNDILSEKYGPINDRGDKGMFTSPTMWDHIHMGY